MPCCGQLLRCPSPRRWPDRRTVYQNELHTIMFCVSPGPVNRARYPAHSGAAGRGHRVDGDDRRPPSLGSVHLRGRTFCQVGPGTDRKRNLYGREQHDQYLDHRRDLRFVTSFVPGGAIQSGDRCSHVQGPFFLAAQAIGTAARWARPGGRPALRAPTISCCQGLSGAFRCIDAYAWEEGVDEFGVE